MTAYGQYITKQTKPAPLLSYNSVDEKKTARKKLLDEVFRRRERNYKAFLEKKRLQSKQTVI